MLKRAFEAASLPALVMKIMRANYDPPAPIFSDNLRRIISKCLSLEPHRRPTTSQLLCEPILFSSMLPLYASIGAYVPSSNKRKAKNNNAQSSLIKSHVRSSRVFLWGDGHLTPRELPVPNDVGVVNNVLISGGVRVGTTDQVFTLLHSRRLILRISFLLGMLLFPQMDWRNTNQEELGNRDSAM